MNIALLGGAFNPITKGHIELAESVFALGEYNQVWLVPCFSHAFDKKLVSPYHRLIMASLATIQYDNIRICDYEIENSLSGFTYDLINKITEDCLSEFESVSWVVGLDNANNIDSWHQSEYLKENAKFIVVKRQGVDQDPNINWYMEPPHQFIDAGEKIRKISSTDVREALKNGDQSFAEKHLNLLVLRHIQKYKLY